MRYRVSVCAAAVLFIIAGVAFASDALSYEYEVIAPIHPVPDYVDALLDVARGELGYMEQGGVTKYGQWAGDPKAEWCAEFLCWSVDQVDKRLGTNLLTQVYPFYSASNTGRDWFLKQGRYVARTGFVNGWGTQWYIGSDQTMPKNSYVPQPGDWVFMSYSASGDTSHVAMVEQSVRKPDGTIDIHVIEGNNPDRVARAVYPLTAWQIQGYGTVHDVADIVLRMGLEGEKVRSLQERLAYVGLLPGEEVHGRYSQRTSDAVKAFQLMVGQVPTGIANHQTQLSLREYVRKWRMENADSWTVDSAL
ncbi:MAG: peptidoglycan-binding protein [Christensenellales bacterium]|jgi:hypothetical protein